MTDHHDRLLFVTLTLLLLAVLTGQAQGQVAGGSVVTGQLGGWATTGQLVLTEQYSTATREVQISGHYFVVSYAYNVAGPAFVPAVPRANTHYSADISVYEVVNGNKSRIGDIFPGQYIEGGCFEDIPEDQVAHALKAVGRLTPELKAFLEKSKTAANFEAMELYRLEPDGELAVTAKGARDLKRITVDGKEVWKK